MKKISLLLTYVLISSILTPSYAQKYGGPQPLSFNTVSSKAAQGNIKADVSIEYPSTGASYTFLNGFCNILNDRLSEIVSPVLDENDTKELQLTTDVSKTADAVANFFTDEALNFQRRSFYESIDEDDPSPQVFDPEECLPCELTLNCEKLYSNYHFASFGNFGYIYLGGAHGMPITDIYTITREDGKMVELEDVFPPATHNKLKAIVYRNLLKEFDGDESALWEDASTKLPDAMGFALLKEGVRFQYDAYEIGPYAIGTPTCTVPYSQLTSIMTSKAKRWLRN